MAEEKDESLADFAEKLEQEIAKARKLGMRGSLMAQRAEADAKKIMLSAMLNLYEYSCDQERNN